jgi:hypothetical protein
MHFSCGLAEPVEALRGITPMSTSSVRLGSSMPSLPATRRPRA